MGIRDISSDLSYNEHERNLTAALMNGPLIFSDAAAAAGCDEYNFNTARLENEGIIIRCALTPTDMMHIKGDFSDKDKPEDLDIKMSMLLMQFLFPNEKINKMKTRKGVNVEAQSIKSSLKDLTILLSGNCFSRIVMDQRNFQSLATLLSYCTSLLAYQFTPNNKYTLPND